MSKKGFKLKKKCPDCGRRLWASSGVISCKTVGCDNKSKGRNR